MKTCGVAVAIMWSYSMEGNPVFLSLYPWSLISTVFDVVVVVVVVISRLCFVLFFRFCVILFVSLFSI